MPRFANIKGSMSPFDNNKPVLSSSDRIKNKRDQTIYQAEKIRFQNKRCGDKNVKYYNNGTIRNMRSYKIQNSLARGSVLCEDCNNNGLLCGSISSKSALGSISMGNNVVSEYWGGGTIIIDETSTYKIAQSIAFPVIQADISGTWGGTIKKVDLSNATLPNSIPTVNMHWGYINNLIKIPRNLNGLGIVIDPSHNLFPDGHCASFKHQKSHLPYLKHSNLKTYLVISTVFSVDFANLPHTPLACGDASANDIVGQQILAWGNGLEVIWSGIVKYVCCKNTETISVSQSDEFHPGLITTPGWSIFDIYIELQYIGNYDSLNKMVSSSPVYDPTTARIDGFDVIFLIWFNLPSVPGIINTWWVESFRIFQGSPELNQTQHNKTKQSYMSCLENRTKKIKFT